MSELPQTSLETDRPPTGGNLIRLIVAWLWVGVPLAWGVLETVRQSLALFQ